MISGNLTITIIFWVTLFLVIASFLACIIKPNTHIKFTILTMTYEGPIAGLWPILIFGLLSLGILIQANSGLFNLLSGN